MCCFPSAASLKHRTPVRNHGLGEGGWLRRAVGERWARGALCPTLWTDTQLPQGRRLPQRFPEVKKQGSTQVQSTSSLSTAQIPRPALSLPTPVTLGTKLWAWVFSPIKSDDETTVLTGSPQGRDETVRVAFRNTQQLLGVLVSVLGHGQHFPSAQNKQLVIFMHSSCPQRILCDVQPCFRPGGRHFLPLLPLRPAVSQPGPSNPAVLSLTALSI